MTCPNVWRALLGVGDHAPIEEVGVDVAMLYIWMLHRAQLPDADAFRTTLIDEDNPWEPKEVPFDGAIPYAAVYQSEASPHAPRFDQINALSGLYHSGWIYDYMASSAERAPDVGVARDDVLVAYLGAWHPEVKALLWAAEQRLRDDASKGLVAGEMRHLLLDLGLVPAGAVQESPMGGETQFDVDVESPRQDDDQHDRMEALQDVAKEQREETGEVIDDRRERWKQKRQQRGEDLFGRTGSEALLEDADSHLDPEGPYGYSATKPGLFHLYQNLYRKTFEVDPPPLFTQGGKPSAKAAKLGSLADDFSVKLAMDAVVFLLERWDEINRVDPPLPALVHHLGKKVCFAIQRDQDPEDVLSGFRSDGGVDDDEWTGMDETDEATADEWK